jgi:DNA-binding transcriptional LysR family regulator
MLGYLGENIIDQYNRRSDAQVLLTDELPDMVCEQHLLQGDYDVCLTTSPVSDPGIIAVPIVRDYQFFWVNRRNPLSGLDRIEPRDLDGQTVCTLREDYKSTPIFLRLCDEAGVKVRMDYTTEMINVYEHARAGRAIGLTCRNHVLATIDSQQTVGVPLKSLPWGIVACRRRDAIPSPATLGFIDYLRTLSRKYD